MSNKPFIYVFSRKDRDVLLALGMRLLASHDDEEIYAFENQHEKNFSLDDIVTVESDVLTF